MMFKRYFLNFRSLVLYEIKLKNLVVLLIVKEIWTLGLFDLRLCSRELKELGQSY